MVKLKKGERLVYAGVAALRAPDGTPLPSVPQYVIQTDNNTTAAATPLKKTERLITVGRELSEKKRAEERYAALVAGQKCPPKEAEGIPLYIIGDMGKCNNAGFTPDDEKTNAELAAELAANFALHMQELEAAGQA